MNNIENLKEALTAQAEGATFKTIEDYVLPCKPGDEAWYIESSLNKPICVKKGIVKMIGFTFNTVQLTFEGFPFVFSKPYTWNKNAFATEEEAEQALKANRENPEKASASFYDLIEKLKSMKTERTLEESE